MWAQEDGLPPKRWEGGRVLKMIIEKCYYLSAEMHTGDSNGSRRNHDNVYLASEEVSDRCDERCADGVASQRKVNLLVSNQVIALP
jgi:hypothetical protein